MLPSSTTLKWKQPRPFSPYLSYRKVNSKLEHNMSVSVNYSPTNVYKTKAAPICE